MLKTTVGVSLLLVASVSCGPSPLTPTPSPVPGVLPSVSGLVTGVDAARQPGVTVRLEAGSRRILASSQLDQAGRFVLPPVKDFCDVVGSVLVVVGGEGVRTESRSLPRCETIIDGPAIDVGTIRLQEWIVVVPGRVFDLQLSNGDMDLGDDQYDGQYDVYACGPCKLLDLVGAREGMTLLVEWSSPDPLVVWLEAETNGWGPAKFSEHRAAPGQRAIAVPIPANWQYPHEAWIKIGLPRSSRATGGLVEPANIRVSLR